MSLRFWLNVSTFVGVCIFTGYMLRQEVLESKLISQEMNYIDRLVKLDIQYLETERDTNWEHFGLEGTMKRRAQRKIEEWEKKKSKIEKLLVDALDDNKEQIEKAFCIKNSRERPRYYAAMFLIEKDKEKGFDVIDLKRISKLEVQEWSKVIPFDVVYEKLELREDPKKDTTKMFVAALFADKVDSIVDEDFPWGEGSNWSWDDVQKQEKAIDIEEKVTSYLAMMHLFMELASNPAKRICMNNQ